MTTVEVNLYSEYGIMFLHDTSIDAAIPDNAGRDPVMNTSTCLSFDVLIYVEGKAKITLSDKIRSMSCKEYFRGRIECPSKSVSISDSNENIYASVPLKNEFADISLRMSEERNPKVVECVIHNMDVF